MHIKTVLSLYFWKVSVDLLVCPIAPEVQTHQTIQAHEKVWSCYWHQESLNNVLQYYKSAALERNRLPVRQHVKARGYTSLLDIGFGSGVDFLLFKDEMTIDYFGLEFEQNIVDTGIAHGIKARKGSIENIPFESNSVDVCYTRQVIESCEYYEKALNEMVRVAQKEVIVVFFVPPTDQPDMQKIRNFKEGTWYYANHYNKEKLEQFILSHAKVKNIAWTNTDILHIHLKDNEPCTSS